MTHGLSKGKKINKTSFNTLIVLTQPLSLQWKTTRRMVPSPSWTPLLNQRLMVSCLSLYIQSTHRDQYLQWDSHHHLSAKYILINTHTHRAKTGCNKPEILQKIWSTSGKHSLTASTQNGPWTRVEKRLTKQTSEVSNVANNHGTTGTQLITNEVKMKGHIVIPYTQGLSKSIKKICSRYGIQTHFKGNNTIKNLLVSPYDKDPMADNSWAIYWFQCEDLICDDEYIGGNL